MNSKNDTSANPVTLKLLNEGEIKRLRLNDISSLTFVNLMNYVDENFPVTDTHYVVRKLFYFDEESDKITISGDDDLKEAVTNQLEDMKATIFKVHVEIIVDKMVSTDNTGTSTTTAPKSNSKSVSESNDKKSFTKVDEETSETKVNEGLSTFLGLFNLEILSPIAQQWLDTMVATGDDRAVFVSNLLGNPEFINAVAEMRTSEDGSRIFDSLEENCGSFMNFGTNPSAFMFGGGMMSPIPMMMMSGQSYLFDGSLQRVLSPIFVKFPEIFENFPVLRMFFSTDDDEAPPARHPFTGAMGGGCPTTRPGRCAPNRRRHHPWNAFGRCPMGRRSYENAGRCGVQKATTPAAASTADRPTSTSATGSSVKEREASRNECALRAAIQASLDTYCDEYSASATTAATSTVNAGDSGIGESKENDNTSEDVTVVIQESSIKDDPVVARDDITSSDGEFETIPSMESKWKKELDVLSTMGFDDLDINVKLLEEKDGNLRDVVSFLL